MYKGHELVAHKTIKRQPRHLGRYLNVLRTLHSNHVPTGIKLFCNNNPYHIEINQLSRIADQWTGSQMTLVLTERNSRTRTIHKQASTLDIWDKLIAHTRFRRNPRYLGCCMNVLCTLNVHWDITNSSQKLLSRKPC